MTIHQLFCRIFVRDISTKLQYGKYTIFTYTGQPKESRKLYPIHRIVLLIHVGLFSIYAFRTHTCMHIKRINSGQVVVELTRVI